MDIATLTGLVGGVIVTLVVMALSGSMLMYWDSLSILVVVGGSLMSVMMRWPFKTFLSGIVVGMHAFIDNVSDPHALISRICELAQVARKNSILALEKEVVDDKFLAKAVKYMVDGYDPQVIADIIDFEMDGMRQRHRDGRAIFENMGEACPAFGMIGTVIGLIVIMANLSDPDRIGPGLAVALITTLYGALLANAVFIPIAQKLKYRSQMEGLNLEIIKEGVASITKGENPGLLESAWSRFYLRIVVLLLRTSCVNRGAIVALLVFFFLEESCGCFSRIKKG